MSTPTSKEASLHLEEGEEPSDSENELKRKMSSASVFSTDGGEDDDDDGEDDDDDRKGANVVLGPQLALKEQLEMDKDDESLRKWKEQLLAGVDLTEVG
ncbi:rho GDP-dissociation inhibitor 1-like, partial [Phalaenopsis equestris]